MNVYLISYDLTNHAAFSNYQNLIAKIKSYGTWAKPLQSVWLIQTYETVQGVRDSLLPLISNKDKLFVIDVSQKNWAAYGLPTDVVEWVRNHISA